jgi:hypothetical protein
VNTSRQKALFFVVEEQQRDSQSAFILVNLLMRVYAEFGFIAWEAHCQVYIC